MYITAYTKRTNREIEHSQQSTVQYSTVRYTQVHPIPSHPITSHLTHIISCYIPSHPIPSHPIPSHHTTSHHITLHYMTPRHVISHRIIPRHVISHVRTSTAASMLSLALRIESSRSAFLLLWDDSSSSFSSPTSSCHSVVELRTNEMVTIEGMQ